MEAKLERLSLNVPAQQTASKSKTQSRKEVAESWEDELLSDSDTETESGNNPNFHSHSKSEDSVPNAPPPTPIASSGRQGSDFREWTSSTSESLGARQKLDLRDTERRRPEKSTAVASRMIAAGLGVKTPKRSSEQRTYDRAVKEQEIRRKNREKDEKEKERREDERVKQTAWSG